MTIVGNEASMKRKEKDFWGKENWEPSPKRKRSAVVKTPSRKTKHPPKKQRNKVPEVSAPLADFELGFAAPGLSPPQEKGIVIPDLSPLQKKDTALVISLATSGSGSSTPSSDKQVCTCR